MGSEETWSSELLSGTIERSGSGVGGDVVVL